MIDDGQVKEEAVKTDLATAKRSLNDYPSNAASVYPGFNYTPGLQPKEEPELSLSNLGKSVYAISPWGLTQTLTEDALRPDYAPPGYNFIEHVDDEFLNDQDIWYFVNDVNSSQTQANNRKLKREKDTAQGLANYPITYFGAYAAEGLVDPILWFFPGSRIATATKSAYEAAKAGKGIMTAKALAQAGGESALLGFGASSAQEALIQQTEVSRETVDAVYNVMATTALSGILGAAIPGVISGYHYGKARSQVANILADNTPTPTRAPTGRLYAMDETTKATMKGDDVIAALPEITKKTLNISPAGRLRNSPSVSANMASSDLATTSLTLNKNIKNQPTQIAVDEYIAQYRGKSRKALLDINAIFMEQQGVSGNLFGGIRSRIAETRKQGLGRKDFSEAMFKSMESGQQSAYPAVNKAVTRAKEFLTEIKQELVELGKLDKKFLEPEFDNYFTHHWLEPVIFRNHENFKLLMVKWFSEVNNFYKANKETIEPLKRRVEFAESKYAKANQNMARVKDSPEYKQFQLTKKESQTSLTQKRAKILSEKKRINKEIKELNKSLLPEDVKKLNEKIKQRDEFDIALKEISAEYKKTKGLRYERVRQLEKRIEKYKKELEIRKESLYSVIPSKYLTPGGWIPTGDKNPLELHAAAMQTFYRTTGSDVASFINPIIGGGGKNPDPLQARLLTIPYDYTVTGYDGNTIRASDFLSKDVFKMIDNYAGATASTMAFEKQARARGFNSQAELREFYLNNIKADYDEMLRGKSGKEALDLGRQKKKDFNDLNALWAQQEAMAGKSFDILGQGFARFIRRLRQYNSERLLGSAALSALTDLFVGPFRQGFANFVADWFIPFAKQITGPNKAFKLNKNDIKDLAFASETQLGFIAKKIYDNDDLLIEQKWWQSIAEPAVNMFGNVTGLSQVSDIGQSISGHISISRTLRTLDKKIQTGKISKSNNTRLRHVGISEESERHIYEMWKEKGGKDRGAYYSNATEWNINSEARAKAYAEFTLSWQRDLTHSSLRSSKSEQPAFYDSVLGKLLFHFKDYLLAATQKLFLSGIQKIGMREYDVMVSSMVMMSIGSMTYVLNALAKDPTGESVDLSPEKLLREGLDRSALLGLYMEPINIFQKQGWLPGQTVSRYHSRGILGNWAGPEIGTAQDLADALISPIIRGAKGEGNYTTQDALKILRLIPFQNLFYLRYLTEQATKQTAESLGATPKD